MGALLGRGIPAQALLLLDIEQKETIWVEDTLLSLMFGGVSCIIKLAGQASTVIRVYGGGA